MASDNRRAATEEKLRRLQSVTDAALSQLGLEDLLDELLERTRDLLRADTAAILLVDASGSELIATAASGPERAVAQGVRLPVGSGFAGTIAAKGEPMVINDVDGADFGDPALLATRSVSVLGVPMLSGGRVVGVLQIGTATPRRFTDDDTDLLRLVADRASLATQARLSRLDRAAALALQRSLLPTRPQSVDGLDVAARYVPGAEVGVGGDWYDLFALPSGHIGIVIGDVAGSGLHAAVVMGRVRSALRAYALETDDPADVLARLDRKVQLFEPDAMATAVYAVLSPALDTLTVSSAGHYPPVVIPADGPTNAMDLSPDLPLGAYPNAPRRNRQIAVPSGACLFFYTDGLIERRGRNIKAGIQTLHATLRCGPAEATCADAMAAMIGDQPPKDDVAVLALRRIDQTG